MKTFFHGGKIRNFPLSSYTLCQKKRYITKGIQLIFKNFSVCWKMWKIGIWAQKFHGRSYFSFAMVRWKPFFLWKNSKFPTFKLYTVSDKNAISPKPFNRFSKTFLLLKDVENRYLSRKFRWRSKFSFAMAWGKPFFLWKNSKFSTFKLYTASEKMLYHQRNSADFQKLSVSWKMRKIGIWPKNFMGEAVLVLLW